MCKRPPDTLKQAMSSTGLRNWFRKEGTTTSFPCVLTRHQRGCSLSALPEGMAVRTPQSKHINDTLTREPVHRLRCGKWPVSAFTP
jgi:hypothetical protein